jgi:hypothetical protein
MASVTTFSARPARDDEAPRENHIIRAIVTLAVIIFFSGRHCISPEIVRAATNANDDCDLLSWILHARGFFTLRVPC